MSGFHSLIRNVHVVIRYTNNRNIPFRSCIPAMSITVNALGQKVGPLALGEHPSNGTGSTRKCKLSTAVSLLRLSCRGCQV